MNKFMEGIKYLLGYVRVLVFIHGLTLVAILVVGSIGYLRGDLTVFEVDLTEAISGGEGMLAYYWIGIFALWGVLEIIFWSRKIYGWWRHREEIKKKLLERLGSVQG